MAADRAMWDGTARRHARLRPGPGREGQAPQPPRPLSPLETEQQARQLPAVRAVFEAAIAREYPIRQRRRY